MSEFDIALPPEPACFRLGLAGFSAEDCRHIERSIASAASEADWRVGKLAGADAWLVDGKKCRLVEDGKLRVASGVPTERSVNIDIDSVERPVAFALPIGSPEIEVRCAFQVGAPETIERVLTEFDNSFVFERALFTLGQQVVRLGSELRRGVFHVSLRDKLLALLDFRHGRAAVSAQVSPVEVQHAHWAKRPDCAFVVPEGFRRVTTAQIAWSYVTRRDAELLPSRYWHEAIYFRAVPKLPLAWLTDSQLTLLSALSTEPATVAELAAHTAQPEQQVRRDLAVLYYAGSLTTTHTKAGRAWLNANDRCGPQPPMRSAATVPGVLCPGQVGRLA